MCLKHGLGKGLANKNRSHPVLEWTEPERQTAFGISLHGDEGQTKRGRNLLLLSWSAVATTGEPMYFKYPILVI